MAWGHGGIGEHLSLRSGLEGSGVLLHLATHLLRDRARVGELEEQLLNLARVEYGGAGTHQRHSLLGHARGHVGVAVAVASHPRGDAHNARVVRQRRLGGRREGIRSGMGRGVSGGMERRAGTGKVWVEGYDGIPLGCGRDRGIPPGGGDAVGWEWWCACPMRARERSSRR